MRSPTRQAKQALERKSVNSAASVGHTYTISKGSAYVARLTACLKTRTAELGWIIERRKPGKCKRHSIPLDLLTDKEGHSARYGCETCFNEMAAYTYELRCEWVDKVMGLAK